MTGQHDRQDWVLCRFNSYDLVSLYLTVIIPFSIIPQDQICNGVLVLTVFDYDFISANDFEGEAMVRLTDLPRNSEQHVKWTMALHRPKQDSIYKVTVGASVLLFESLYSVATLPENVHSLTILNSIIIFQVSMSKYKNILLITGCPKGYFPFLRLNHDSFSCGCGI